MSVSGITILLCLVAFSGCTQPVIPSPAPAPTTPPPAVTPGATMLPAPTAVSQATTPGASGYLTYANSQYGFSLSYPSTWTVQENTGGSVVLFTAPSSGMGDTPATMRVSVEDLSANPMSLEQFRDAQVAKKSGLASFNIVYDLPYKDLNGWKFGYTYLSGTIMRSFEVYTIRGTMGYIIAFTSRDDRFASLTVVSDTMFKSFRFIG